MSILDIDTEYRKRIRIQKGKFEERTGKDIAMKTIVWDGRWGYQEERLKMGEGKESGVNQMNQITWSENGIYKKEKIYRALEEATENVKEKRDRERDREREEKEGEGQKE